MGAGWGVIQAIKHIATEHQLNAKDFDLKWEQPKPADLPQV